MDRPWTVREAAAYLSRTPATIQRWARAGKLPGQQDPAGGWRFAPEDVRALLRAPAAAKVDQELIRRRLDLSWARAQIGKRSG